MTADVIPFTWGGPTGRRCMTCALPVAEGVAPSEMLDGRLLLECVACEERRIEDRERARRIREGKGTPEDYCGGDVAALWRLRVEGE